MCFKKDDCFIWIRYEGQKMMLWLRADGDGSRYDDYFTIERVQPGRSREVACTYPFGEITAITYDTAFAPDLCAIRFEMGARIETVEVERHCFNLLLVRKMIGVWKKWKKRG